MWTCLCLHIAAQLLTKPGFQQIVNKAKIPPVHCICPWCLSVFCFGLFIFPPPTVCLSFSVLWTAPLLFSLVICPSTSRSLIQFLRCCLFHARVSSLRFIFRDLFWNRSRGCIQAGHLLITPYLYSGRCFSAQSNLNLSTRGKSGVQETGE